MRTSSVKAKGRRLQNFVAGVFLTIGTKCGHRLAPINLKIGDVEPRQMGGAGVDTIFSPFAKEMFPFAIECKNVEKLNIVEAYCENAKKNGAESFPILVHSKNRSGVLVTLSFEDFLNLVYMGKIHPGAIRQILDHCDENKDTWASILRYVEQEQEMEKY